jgi:hypothetical protein
MEGTCGEDDCSNDKEGARDMVTACELMHPGLLVDDWRTGVTK